MVSGRTTHKQQGCLPDDVTDRRLLHEPATGGESRVLATEVEVADSFLSKARGLMFRTSIPEEFALVMEVGGGLFGDSSEQAVHMLFVRMPLDVVWLLDDEVQLVERLDPWGGHSGTRTDRIVELPAGGAAGVAVGDTVRLD